MINREIRQYAKEHNLKPSFTVYKQWGAKGRHILRFSKSGDPAIEKNCATHYVDSERIAKLRAEKEKEQGETEAQNQQ